MALPSFLQSCLASYDLSKMDKNRHKETIITSVKEIEEVVASPQRGMWFREVLTYWQKILDIKIPRFKRELAYFNLNPNPDLYKKFFKI